MTTLVARLRRLSFCSPGCSGRCLECPDEIAREAADEIERLLLVEIYARNVAVNANRGNDGVSAVPGCVINDLRGALKLSTEK